MDLVNSNISNAGLIIEKSYCSESFKNSRLFSNNFKSNENSFEITKLQQEWFDILQIVRDNQVNAVNIIKSNLPSSLYEITPPLAAVPIHNHDLTDQHSNSDFFQRDAQQNKIGDSSLSLCSNSNASNDPATLDSANTSSPSSTVSYHSSLTAVSCLNFVTFLT